MDTLKTSLMIGVGTWVVTRSLRWGIPHLIPQNPEVGSLGDKIKRVYDGFLNSKHQVLVWTRILLGDVYDFLPLSLPVTYAYDFKGKLPQEDQYKYFIRLCVTWEYIFKTAWIFGFTAILYLSRQQRYPNAAALAQRIMPYIELTAHSDHSLAEPFHLDI